MELCYAKELLSVCPEKLDAQSQPIHQWQKDTTNIQDQLLAMEQPTKIQDQLLAMEQPTNIQDQLPAMEQPTNTQDQPPAMEQPTNIQDQIQAMEQPTNIHYQLQAVEQPTNFQDTLQAMGRTWHTITTGLTLEKTPIGTMIELKSIHQMGEVNTCMTKQLVIILITPLVEWTQHKDRIHNQLLVCGDLKSETLHISFNFNR